MISNYFMDTVTVVLILVFIFNLTQRKHLEYGEKKRLASLFFAFGLLILYAGLLIITRRRLHDLFICIPVFLSLVFYIVFRKKIFIFNRQCTSPGCSGKVSLKNTLYHDEPLCKSCRNSKPQIPDDTDQIDWNHWKPTEQATLCFIRNKDEILLIHKKRGLGKGKINGPGGRIDPGETAKEAAVRETEEEVGLTPLNPELRGELNFQFKDGYGLKGYVYYTEDFEGTLVETDEADPFWCKINQIPYEKMWADDIFWIKHMLNNHFFKGYFVFDGDKMISHKVKTEQSKNITQP